MDQPLAAERKRVKLACDECRKNKRKCGGERPICALCEKTKRNCSYPTGSSARKRKNDDDDYVRGLEDQLETLKLLLGASGQNVDSSSLLPLAETEDNNPQHSNEDIFQDDPSGPSGDQRSTFAMEELSNMMLKMGVDDQGEPSFTIPTSGSRPRERSATTVSNTASQSPNTAAKMVSDYDQRNYVEDLDLRLALFKTFMENFNPYHYFIYAESPTIHIETLFNGDLDMQLYGFSICAVGARFLQWPNRHSISRQYKQLAEAILVSCLRDFAGAATIKALSLLAWLELVEGNDAMSFSYISMATGMILMLGYHVTALDKIPNPESYGDTNIISRIRTFWSYFCIDRIVVAVLGMTCTIPWPRVRVPPMLTTLSRQGSDEELAFNYQGQLWHLWDSSMDQIYAFDWANLSPTSKHSVLMRAHTALTTFHNNLPPQMSPASFRNSQTSSPSVIYLQMNCHTAILLIYRPFLSVPLNSTTLRFILRSLTASAASTSRLIRLLRKTSSFATAPLSVLNSILSAAIVHLLNATAGSRTTLGRQSASGLRACVEALEEASAMWSVRAEKAIRLVREFAKRWGVVWVLPLRLSNPIEVLDDSGGIPIEDKNIMEEEYGSGFGTATVGGFGAWSDIQFGNVLGQINDMTGLADDGALEWLFGSDLSDLAFDDGQTWAV